MKRLLYSLLVAILTISLCFSSISISQAIGIATPIETGFVVVTPLQGNGQGISVSETFGQRVDGSLFQASVLTSPPVTLTDVFVTVDPITATDTGIAIVNPTNSTGTITLSLTNQQGANVAIRTITIGGMQQVSRFATEVFAGIPEMGTSFSGLLFISSDVPIGAMGLTFIGPSFTSLPVASQLSPSSTINAGIPATPATAIATVNPGIAATTITTPAPTVTATGVIVPSTITQIPSTVLGLPSTTIGLPPSQPITFPIAPPVPTISGPVITVVPTTSITNSVTLTSQVTSSIPVISGLLLPQFATGGGWGTQIVISNTSPNAQVVRVDIFNSAGGRLVLPFDSNLSSVSIPAGGVVTFSTL
jgi:hypothetical protein